MQLNAELVQKLAAELIKSGMILSAHDINKAFADLAKTNGRGVSAENGGVSITRIIRGLSAMKGNVLNTQSVDEDTNFVKKSLTTGATPGSYLVPTVQADAIVEILGKGAAVRASGATIWPMAGVQKMNIPSETAEPTVEFLSQNTAQNASDPGIGQLALDLKTQRALVALPNELLKASVPALDQIVTRLLGKAFAKHEDLAFFQGIAGGPVAVSATPSTTTINQAGATLAYADLLKVLANFANVEGENGVWFMHPNVFFNHVLAMTDSQGRPIVTGYNSLVGGANDGGSAFVGQLAGEAGAIKFLLLGRPVYTSVRIPQHVGSGSASSYILFANPSNSFHIGDAGGLEIAQSGERFFAENQTAIRCVRQIDFAYGNPSAIVLLNDVR